MSPFVAMKNPVLAGNYVLCLIGSAAPDVLRSTVVGGMALISWFIIKYFRRPMNSGDFIILFILASALMAMLNRVLFGLSAAIDTRYAIYSLLFIAVIFSEGIALVLSPRKQACVFTLLLCVSCAYSYYTFRVYKKEIEASMAWVSGLKVRPDGQFTLIADFFFHDESEKTLRRSFELGIYVPPAI